MVQGLAGRTHQASGGAVQVALQLGPGELGQAGGCAQVSTGHQGGQGALGMVLVRVDADRQACQLVTHDVVVLEATCPGAGHQLGEVTVVARGCRGGRVTLELQGRHRDPPAVVHVPDDLVAGDPDVAEEHLGEPGVPVQLADGPHLDAGAVEVDGQHRDALVARRVRVRAHQREHPVGPGAVGGPDLLARDDPVVAVAHGARREAGEVRACVRLGVALGPDHLGGQDARQPPGLLHLGAVGHQGGAEQVVADHGDALGAASAQVLVLEDRLLDGPGAASAVLLGPVDRRVPGRDQLLFPRDVLGEPLVRPGGREADGHVRGKPRAQAIAEGPLFVGQVELHPVGSLAHRPWRGRRRRHRLSHVSDGVSD